MAEQQDFLSPERIGKVIDELKQIYRLESDEDVFRMLIMLLKYWPDNRKGKSEVLVGRLGSRVASAVRRAKRLLHIEKQETVLDIAIDMFLSYAAARRERGAINELVLYVGEIEKAIREAEGPE